MSPGAVGLAPFQRDQPLLAVVLPEREAEAVQVGGVDGGCLIGGEEGGATVLIEVEATVLEVGNDDAVVVGVGGHVVVLSHYEYAFSVAGVDEFVNQLPARMSGGGW